MAIPAVDESSFDDKVLKNKNPVLVDFWAPWCSPCKIAEPVLEELAEEYKQNLQIVKLNVDENPSLSNKYGVLSIPTTILFRDNKELGRQVGFAGKNAFLDLIKKAL